jgi:hypothetical protein
VGCGPDIVCQGDPTDSGSHCPEPADDRFPHLVNAFETALTDPDADRALTAKTLAIPQETELADRFETIDVDAIHTARQFLKTHLAEVLKPLFLKTIGVCGNSDPDSIAFQDTADRSLKIWPCPTWEVMAEKKPMIWCLMHFQRQRT